MKKMMDAMKQREGEVLSAFQLAGIYKLINSNAVFLNFNFRIVWFTTAPLSGKGTQ